MRLEAAHDMLRDRPYETGIVRPLDGDGGVILSRKLQIDP